MLLALLLRPSNCSFILAKGTSTTGLMVHERDGLWLFQGTTDRWSPKGARYRSPLHGRTLEPQGLLVSSVFRIQFAFGFFLDFFGETLTYRIQCFCGTWGIRCLYKFFRGDQCVQISCSILFLVVPWIMQFFVHILSKTVKNLPMKNLKIDLTTSTRCKLHAIFTSFNNSDRSSVST